MWIKVKNIGAKSVKVLRADITTSALASQPTNGFQSICTEFQFNSKSCCDLSHHTISCNYEQMHFSVLGGTVYFNLFGLKTGGICTTGFLDKYFDIQAQIS